MCLTKTLQIKVSAEPNYLARNVLMFLVDISKWESYLLLSMKGYSAFVEKENDIYDGLKFKLTKKKFYYKRKLTADDISVKLSLMCIFNCC